MSLGQRLKNFFTIGEGPTKQRIQGRLYQIYCIIGAFVTPAFIYLVYGFEETNLNILCGIITGFLVVSLVLSFVSEWYKQRLAHILFGSFTLLNVYVFWQLKAADYHYGMLIPALLTLMATSVTAPGPIYPVIYASTMTVLSLIFSPSEEAEVGVAYFIGYVVFIGIVTSIVQRFRVKIMKHLRTSEHFLATIFNNTHEAILLVDFFSRKVIDCNDITLQLFELESKEDIIGQYRDVFETESLSERELVECRKEMKMEGSWSRVIPHRTKKGKDFIAEVKISPINISDKQYYVARITDITEKVEAEKAIKAGQEQLALIINNIEEVVYRVDLTGDSSKLDYISPQVEQIFGYTREQYNDRSLKLLSYYHPDDLPELQRRLEEYKKTKHPTTLVYRFRHVVTDEERWIEETIYPQLDEDGNHVANFGVARDATEKLEAEEALKESKDQLDSVLRSIDDIVYNVQLGENGEKSIRYVSPQIEELTGYSVEEYKAQVSSGDVVNNFHPDDIDYVRQVVKSVYEKKMPISMVYRYFSKKADDYVWFEEKMFPKLDEDGNHVANLGIIRDFSERKLYENTLKKNQERLSMILHNIDEMVYNISLDDSGGKTIEYVSPQIEKLFGVSEGEYIEKTRTGELTERYHPDDITDLAEVQEKIKKQKKSVTIQYRFMPPNSESYSWFEERIFPQFDENGKHIAQFGIVRDVTNKITSEQQLKISERSYKDIFNNSTDLLFIIDEEDKIIDINTAVTKKYGHARKTIIGSTLDLFKATSKDLEKVNMKEMLQKSRTSRAQSFDWWTSSKSGRDIPIELILRKGNYFGQDVIIGTGRDISERIETQEALRRSEEWYRTLFERNLAGVFRTELGGPIVDCNEAFAKIFGYKTKKQLLGADARNLYFSDADRKNYIKDLKKTGTLTNYELRHKKKDGSTLWVLANISLTPGDDGKKKYLEGTLIDITQQKETDTALRVSEEKFRTLFERNLAGVLQTTIDGLIVDANDAFAKMIGYNTRNQLLKKRTHDLFIDKDDRTHYLNMILEKGSLTNHELRLRRKDGSIMWALVNESVIYDAEGHPETIEGTLIDITELKNTGEALIESESRFKLLAESTIEGIVISDGGIMIDFNDQFLKLFGYKRHELLNKDINMVIAPRFRKEVAKYIKSGSTDPYEGIALTKDGKEIIVETTGQSIPYNGRTVRVSVLYDITRRKQYEEELRASRETFQNLVERSPDGIFIHFDGVMEYANPTALNLLGIKDFSKLRGKKFYSLFKGRHADRIKSRIARLKKGKTPPYEELVMKKADGSELDIGLQSLNTIYNGKRAIHAIVYDLTQQKQLADEKLRASIAEAHNVQLEKEIVEHQRTQRQLQESEKFIKSIIDSSLDVIMASDANYMITEFNRAAENTFGHKKKQMMGLSPEVLYASTKDYKMVRKAIKETGNFSGEITNIRKNGEEFISYLAASVIKDEQGKFQGIMGISRDITEIKKAEQVIKDNEERYRAVYEQAYIGISLFDLEGKFIKANQQLCEVLGYSEEELENMTYLDVTHPDDVKKTNEYRRRMLKGNLDRISYEKRYIHKQGRTVHVNLTVANVKDDSGKPIYFISVIEDITERKEAEAELKASLEEKEVLLKEVHHRVKNNLQVISSILNLQSSYVKDEGTLAILHESQNRIKSMSFIHESLYQTKNFSSIDFSEYIINLTNNLLQSYRLAEDEVDMQQQIDKIQIGLDQAIPCGLIINELVSNALKYAFKPKSKGTIRIALSEKKGKVTLMIEDDGIGLPKDFDYTQAESLGLQLVHTLVEQLDGQIKVSSKKGTKYLISFVKQNAQ